MLLHNRISFANSVLAAAALLAAASQAQAGYVVTLEQQGSDVVATGSGSLNISALSYSSSFNNIAAGLNASIGVFGVGPVSNTSYSIYSGSLSGPTSFGSGTDYYPSSGSGDTVGVVGVTGSTGVFVPGGYTSGSSLSSSSTYSGTTLADLGVTPGTYTWTWDIVTMPVGPTPPGGGATDFFTLEIVAPTPEPSTFGLFALTAAGLTLGGYLRRRSARVV